MKGIWLMSLLIILQLSYIKASIKYVSHGKLEKLGWNERKHFCGEDIGDMMSQLCRNVYRDPKRFTVNDPNFNWIKTQCCADDTKGCTPLSLRSYCTEEERMSPPNYRLYSNLPRRKSDNSPKQMHRKLITTVTQKTTTTTESYKYQKCSVPYPNGEPHLFKSDDIWELKRCLDRQNTPIEIPETEQ